MSIPVPNEVSIPEIDTKSLTESTLDGNGVFDVMMKASYFIDREMDNIFCQTNN